MPPSKLASLNAALLLSLTLAAKQDCRQGTFFTGTTCTKCPAGTYQNFPAQTTCKPCPPGTFNPTTGLEGEDACRLCRPGTFSRASATTCTRCPAGTASDAGNSRCISCTPGLFIDGNINPPRCRPCDAGSFNADPTAIRCKRCPRAASGRPSGPGCEPECPPDSGAFGRKCKTSCPDFKLVSLDCRPCQVGFRANRKKFATKCLPCPRGTRGMLPSRRSDVPTCERCAKGENSFVTGATACVPDFTPCPSNFFRDGKGNCARCNHAEKLDLDQNKCVPCNKNEESPGGTATKCKPCAAGAVRSPKGCICPIGSERASDGTCKLCPPGTVGDLTPRNLGRRCRQCPPGSVAPRAGMAACVRCRIGLVQMLPGQSKCEKCPKGQVPSRDQSLCNLAQSGCPVWAERINSPEFSSFFCNATRDCPIGSVKQNSFDSEILELELGTKGPFISCIPCGAGFSFDGNICSTCPDEYEALGGRSPCRQCKKTEAVFVPELGCECKLGARLVNGNCENCPPGTFGSALFSGCRKCPVGTFQERAGRETCRDCDAGTFTGVKGSLACKPCPNGTISAVKGSANCVIPGSLAI